MLRHEVIFESDGRVVVKAEFDLRATRGEDKKCFGLKSAVELLEGLEFKKVLRSDYIVNYHPNRLKGEWHFLLESKKAKKKEAEPKVVEPVELDVEALKASVRVAKAFDEVEEEPEPKKKTTKKKKKTK